MTITCYRKQYPVGQGGLHLGIIKYPHQYHNLTIHNHFAYIFDCGCAKTRENIQSQIDNIINKLQNIDNLTYLYIFISHIHDDHVNGLNYLCDKIISTLNLPYGHIVIIIPYMEEAEKIITFGNLLDTQNNNIDFLINPQNIFYNNIMVQYLNNTQPEENISYQDFLYNIPTADINGNLSHNNNFIFSNSYIPNDTWILKPFYNKIDSFTLQNLKYELEFAGINITNFRNPNFTKTLRNIYKKYHINLNTSSLCLYSGTTTLWDYTPTGWLHTGDINFNIANTKSKFLNHYIKEIDNVRVIQIPHHGSKHNSSLKDFTKFWRLKSLFVTTQNQTNGRNYPHVSEEYKKIAIQLTETATPIWSYERPYISIQTNLI